MCPDKGRLLPQPTTFHCQYFLQLLQTKIRFQERITGAPSWFWLSLIVFLSPLKGK